MNGFLVRSFDSDMICQVNISIFCGSQPVSQVSSFPTCSSAFLSPLSTSKACGDDPSQIRAIFSEPSFQVAAPQWMHGWIAKRRRRWRLVQLIERCHDCIQESESQFLVVGVTHPASKKTIGRDNLEYLVTQRLGRERGINENLERKYKKSIKYKYVNVFGSDFLYWKKKKNNKLKKLFLLVQENDSRQVSLWA